MRLIDADALLEKVQFRNPIDNHNAEVIAGCVKLTRRIINNSPTIDAVPVVRCEECKHCGGITFGNVCRRWSAPLAGMKNCTRADDFCSYGERKENTDG